MFKLHDWVDINKIDCNGLSTNPNAIELLKENPDNIDWFNLSSNPNAIELLKENKNILILKIMSANPSIFELYINETEINKINRKLNLALS